MRIRRSRLFFGFLEEQGLGGTQLRRNLLLESISSVCGRTTYFALGQSRQSRPEASQIFHAAKAGPRTPCLPPAIAWIGAFPGGHNPSRLRFRSMAFRRLTVYSRRNALSLRVGVCGKSYSH